MDNILANSLLTVDNVTSEQLQQLFKRANFFYENRLEFHQKPLENKNIILLFFENSTRTLVSFQMATQRLGGQTINVQVEKSSVLKGESFKDTALTLNAMYPDAVVLRHQENDKAIELSKYVDCPVINAGTGTLEHPTQALQDALAIKLHAEKIGKNFNDLTIAICGDIKHSRVAHSNIKLLSSLGATVRIIAPEILMPDTAVNGQTYTDMEQGLKDTDVIMMLRMQRERMQAINIDDESYKKHYSLTNEKLSFAKSSAIVMHPGPVNRGFEITDELLDNHPNTIIQQQVTLGVAMRMAILEHYVR